MPRKTTQGSLEYIIIIGGIIILAAATYFMLRGFTQTTAGETGETIGTVGEKFRLELENLGRSETRFLARKWLNLSLLKLTEQTFDLLDNVTYNLTNLSDHGIDTGTLQFACFDGSFCILNYTTLDDLLTAHTEDSCCPEDNFTLYMYYNNSSALIDPCLANYTGPVLNFCENQELPDSDPPSISIPSTAYGTAGSVKDADIQVTVNGTGSNVSEVYYSIEGSDWFRADNLYYQQGEIMVEAHPSDYSYNNESEIIHIIANVPREDNYTVSVHAADEYGNTRTETREVSIVAGAGEGPVIQLSGSPLYLYRSGEGRIAVSGDNVHVVWYDERDGNTEIYYKNSSDGGITWTNCSVGNCRLTYDSLDSETPEIAVSGSNVHVVWRDERDGNREIYYKNSSDGGITWTNCSVGDCRLTYDTSYSETPEIAVSGDNVHVVWYDDRDGNSEIYYKNSSDGGITWTNCSVGNCRLTYDTYGSYNPEIAVRGSNVHVVWYDYRDGNYEIYYKNSSDGGSTWSAEYNLSENDGEYSYYPAIAVSGDDLHVIWTDERDGNTEIYYKNSSDGGITWTNCSVANCSLTDDSADSSFPKIAVSGNNVHVVWRDLRDGIYQIYYKKSSDGGVTWGDDYRVTDLVNQYLIPDVAASDIVAHVVWTLWIDNYWGVFYRKYWG